MGIYDPIYGSNFEIPNCAKWDDATCSIFASGPASNGYDYFTRACGTYPVSHFPPETIGPGPIDGRIIFDDIFPAALSPALPSLDLRNVYWWIHVADVPGQPTMSINAGVSYYTPSLSYLGFGPSSTFGDGSFRVSSSPAGTWVATTAAPIRVRIYAAITGGPDDIFEFGGAVWANYACETPPVLAATPSRLATIVG